jgi:hypothetical protein
VPTGQIWHRHAFVIFFFLYLFFHSLLAECESNVLLRSSGGNELSTTLERGNLWRQTLSSFILVHVIPTTSESHSLGDRPRRILCGFVFLLMPVSLPCHRLHNKRFDWARSDFFPVSGVRKFKAEHKKPEGKRRVVKKNQDQEVLVLH